MAESQLMCLDDDHVNEKIPESKPEFYYSEEQRAALEQLLKNGDEAFKLRLKKDNIKDFLSAREIRCIRNTFSEYEVESDSEMCDSKSPSNSNADSGVHSTYWPQLSDAEVPSLDIGWPNSGYYKGVTRASVYTHPPKDKSPHIKEVVRRLIQEANKVVAVVMDHLTDLLILQDLVDAGSRRGVAVYILLEAQGLPDFLDMMSRLSLSALALRNLRVRTLQGFGFPLSSGKLSGSLCSKYMLVDGEKVMFGSYSFTWSSSRMDRNMITVMTGHVVDFYDGDFRELYAASQEVDLYSEFHINKPPAAAPVRKTTAEEVATVVAAAAPASVRSQTSKLSTSRFQMPVGDSNPANFKVPMHKYHNPKYSLVVGNSLGGSLFTGSLQDLSSIKDTVEVDTVAVKALQKKFQQAKMASDEHLDKDSTSPLPASSRPIEEEGKAEPSVTSPFGGKKQRSSFRQFLKNKMGGSHTQADGLSKDTKTANHNTEAQTAHVNQDPDTVTTNHVANHNTDERIDNLSKDCNTANHITDAKTLYPYNSKMLERNHNWNANPATNHMDTQPAHLRVEARLGNCRTDTETLNQGSYARSNHVTNYKNPIPRKDATPMDHSTADIIKKVNGHHHVPSAAVSNGIEEAEDTFDIHAKPSLLKFNHKKSSKLGPRTLSLQSLNMGEEDGYKGHRKHHKKNCIQS
ncbi:protein FAM83G-like [Alosa alosa]|uniref:protein FAM83G-like n=1 Tax=Alosa alosa TaxID=278164 RepID=UPI0020154888|nr:protein FAM83G-like [Alosa alosa]XP_048100844.1 protein FAM83G-like [Alosa alosa]